MKVGVKRAAWMVGLAWVGFAGLAWAQPGGCPCGGGTVVVGAALSTLLGGKTVCATAGGSRWQEFHTLGGGALIDYKKGPGDPVDPTETVGSWSVTGESGNVVYNYGSGGTYQYVVCQDTSTVNFCGSGFSGINVVGATLLNGQVACP